MIFFTKHCNRSFQQFPASSRSNTAGEKSAAEPALRQHATAAEQVLKIIIRRKRRSMQKRGLREGGKMCYTTKRTVKFGSSFCGLGNGNAEKI